MFRLIEIKKTIILLTLLGSTSFAQQIRSYNNGLGQCKTPVSGFFIISVIPVNNKVELNLTDMSSIFRNAQMFNQRLIFSDTSNVESMLGMFQNAFSFNQDLLNWCVSKILIYPIFLYMDISQKSSNQFGELVLVLKIKNSLTISVFVLILTNE